jgi:DNA (cytosine-5)-methyltransferase 1
MTKYRVISLFTGIGGMDTGFTEGVVVHRDSVSEDRFIDKDKNVEHSKFVSLKAHHFEIVFQNDILEVSKNVCACNNILSGQYSTESIKDLVKNEFIFPYTDVIICGGVPCYDLCMNEINYSASFYTDIEYVVQRVSPKLFVTDNIEELAKNKSLLNLIVNRFSKIGYDISYQTINCSDYGIPQTRKRLIMFGIRMQGRTTPLKSDWYVLNENKTHCDLKNYLDWNSIENVLGKIHKDVVVIDLDNNQCPPTITPHQTFVVKHTNNRNRVYIKTLSVEELKLIQTFPFDFKISKNDEIAYEQIGNAVPPLLSYIIANKSKNILDEYFL